jgi:peptidoglycan/xylan/chitin deacetylase (PgdA/CDA1 family)
MLRRFAKLTISLGLGLVDRLQPRRAGRGVVLYYHAVPGRHRHRFARQMDQLRKRAQPWALDQEPPRATHWVGISFDDAYVSVLENAVPALLERCLPFTVFVPTGSLGDRPRWIRSPAHPLWNEQVMSKADLRKLVRLPGVTIGSHTVNHPRLTRLTPGELESELRGSKAALEDLVERSVELLSFPHGDWNEAVVEAARAAGYKRLFGIQPACLDGGPLPPVVGRVAVEPDEFLLEFLLKLRGCYRWLARGSEFRTKGQGE